MSLLQNTQKLNMIETPDGEIKDILTSQFHPLFQLDYMKVEGCCMPVTYKKLADEILEFEVKDDDVYVCSFPKSGTTWTQEMVWCIANNLDYETARKLDLDQRFPFIEVSGLFHKDMPFFEELSECVANSFEFIKNLQCRRFIKTHMPFHLLPRQLQFEQSNAKIVYVVRDVWDVCISFYHHYKAMMGFTGNFDAFFKLFINDTVTFAPYWTHVLGFWNIRNQPNVLFIHYEDMKKDLPTVIRRVASLLDKTITPEQVASLNEHLSFENMKKNPSVNKEEATQALNAIFGGDFQFIREGKSGGYVKDMTVSQIDAFNEWSKKHVKHTDYKLI